MICENIKLTMEYIEKITKDMGYPITSKDYYIEDMGCPHVQPKQLPKGYAAIYIFVYKIDDNYEFLKIGKVNQNSNARFVSQHYGTSAPSTLAKSLCNDKEFQNKNVNLDNVKDWMFKNLHRINIYINGDCGKVATEFVESVFHYIYRPRFEGNI